MIKSVWKRAYSMTAVLSLLLSSSLAFGGAASSIEDVRAEWQRTREAVLSDVSREQKTEQINKLFQTIETACHADCANVALRLVQLNTQIDREGRKKIVEKLKETFGAETGVAKSAEETLQKFEAPLNEAAIMANRLENFLKEHPEDFKHRISASLEAVRYLVALEEQALFDALSKNPNTRSAGVEALRKDLEFYGKQGTALAKIYAIMRDYDKTHKIEPAEMQKVVGHIAELGIFYIKLAQTMSNLTFLMPEEVASPLRVFQDSIAPMEPETVIKILTEELGRDPRELFIDFDPAKPLAAGSIAVTYEAKVKTMLGGTKSVIIKVQRPGLAKEIEFNRRFNHFLLKAMAAATPEKLTPVLNFFSDQVVGLENAFESELDFRAEARKLNRFRRLFALDRDVRVPKVIGKYTSKNVITMEKLEGSNLEKAILSGNRIDRFDDKQKELIKNLDSSPTQEQLRRQKNVEGLFSALWESTLYMTFIVGEVHADMHPGNLLAKKLELVEQEGGEAKLSILDFGQTVKTRGLILEPLRAALAAVKGDARGLAKQMSRMSADGKYPAEKLESLIQSVFEEKKIARKGLKTLIMKRDERPDTDALGEALGLIVKRAYSELGYSASSRYVQIFRSIAPVSGSLVALGRELPGKKIAKIMIWGALKTFPLGGVSYLAMKFPIAFLDLVAWTKDSIREFFGERRLQQTLEAAGVSSERAAEVASARGLPFNQETSSRAGARSRCELAFAH